ncbi:bacillithiol biosynthesis cysteine-adding enzyme BshC [Flavobacteriales bacterium 34_180_T64]|nr:bacillithiol biosynthesis cysteine-adding enzyme BshC [Flavobacteriales bacterium 34_180_T64]
MPSDCISFRETNYFSSLICDYLDETPDLKPFYNRFPKLNNFESQIDEKAKSFDTQSRVVLVNALKNQYQNVEQVSDLTISNIDLLSNEKTFTITTGHQLNVFTGPLYFFYKIVSTINLCKTLKEQYPNNNFVPVYWMATEDHDFEEINFFNFKGKKISWNKEASGAVGELDLNGFNDVFRVIASEMDNSQNANELRDLFKNAYLNHDTLTDAMRYLVNALFSKYGLVIVDGNDTNLKQMFIPFIQKEITDQEAFELVTETNSKLNDLDGNYKIQVNPREINLFYITKDLRERIVEIEGEYFVNNTQIKWSKSEILDEVSSFPERFSPNVIMRPLYQEVILPNLCYIGGGGEIAYWLQLKTNFEAQNIPFPMLLLRNSAVLTTRKQNEKLQKLNLTFKDLFLKQIDLETKVTKEISKINIDFSSQKLHLKQQFKELYELAKQTDKSFVGAVGAQEKKQFNGLEHLEKRLLNAQKRKLKDILKRIIELQNALFPNQSLQERQTNFSEFYLEYGDRFIQQLVLNLQPLKSEFLILNLD